MKQKTILYRFLSFVIKAGLILFSVWFIYKQIFLKHNFSDIKEIYHGILTQRNFLSCFIASVLLMPFNWILEAIKWKRMLSKLETISLMKAFQSVVSGVTISFFTPNRVGEFGGRIFYLKKANKIQAALISIFGSMSQLLITIISGCLCFLYFVYLKEQFMSYLFYAVAITMFALIAFLLALYFNISFLKTILLQIPYSERFEKYIQVLSLYSRTELITVLKYSALRYLVFSTQFFLLLQSMNVKIPVMEGMIMIGMTFFVMSVPALGIAEFGIRGIVAIYFIGIYSGNHLGIISASLSLWIINLAVPALLGAIFFLKLRLFKNQEG